MRRAVSLVWLGAAFGSFAQLIGMAAFGRRSRRGKPRRARASDATPVGDEARLYEPLGPGVAWGRLDPLDGRYDGMPYRLTHQYILLGRHNDCDIILDDDRASRYHALLAWDHECCYIRDNESLNGTVVNGQPVHVAIPLRHGDIIEIAGTQFRFLYAPETGLAQDESQPTEKIALPGMAPRSAKAQRGVRARLTALIGPEPGRVWPIVSGVATIGRGRDNLIVLPHNTVSRYHAQILVQDAGLYVQDIGSVNGTSVNGDRLKAPRLLQHLDHIQIGDILLVVALEQPAAGDPVDLPTQHLPSPGATASQSTERLAAPVPSASPAPKSIQFRTVPTRPTKSSRSSKHMTRYKPTPPDDDLPPGGS
jgi:pSer/pThr/pTyr-binding forkhead associated (FHA) protein